MLYRWEVVPVSEGCDDQTRGVTEVLVGVTEHCVTDVYETYVLLVVPPEKERGPLENSGTGGEKRGFKSRSSPVKKEEK